MIVSIIRDECHRSLRVVQAVRPRVVIMAGIPLFLGLQPVVPVPLHQGRQSIGADAINNSVTLCYCRCDYYYSNYGKKTGMLYFDRQCINFNGVGAHISLRQLSLKD